MAEYLARYRRADLFLDTFVYSAGSTAVAALQTGVPVLTLPGIATPSRMGASICAAALLPEMICSSQEKYERSERRPVYLGNNLDELPAIRCKFAENHSSAPCLTPDILCGILKRLSAKSGGIASGGNSILAVRKGFL